MRHNRLLPDASTRPEISRMIRLVRLAAAMLAMATLSVSAPVSAGPDQTAFLNKFVGSWTGTGRLTGAYTASLTCKLAFKATGAKVNYTGRCTLTDLPSQSTSGSLSYNDSAKQYEVRASGKTIVATRNGSTLSFSISQKSIQGSITTNMSISPTAISVTAVLIDNDGKKSNTRMSFTKS
jgi:hypothetical protein